MNIPKDQLAGIWTRVGGALIDLIIVFIVAAIAMFFWGFLAGFQLAMYLMKLGEGVACSRASS